LNIEPSDVAAGRIPTPGASDVAYISVRSVGGESQASRIDPSCRPAVHGKFLFVGDQKFHIRGVTYGTFRPQADGAEFPVPEVVERDFALMAAHGVNSCRTYTVPPRWLLDAAARHGVRLLVGIPVERHVGYLTDRKGAPDTTHLVRDGVAACEIGRASCRERV